MPANYPSLAIVIIHWNKRELLQKFLPSVLQSSYPNLKIYLADNGSTDDSISWLNQNYPEVNCILLDRNYGYASGYNKALAQVDAEYYILLNNDIEVSGNWIEPIIEVMQSNPNIAAAQPQILQVQNNKIFEYAGASGGFVDYLGYVFCRGRVFSNLEENTGQYADTVEIFWASGACLFIKSKAFHEAGGFDDNFFAHMEEVDLCWRLQLLGYKIMAVSSVSVSHQGGATLQRSHPQKTYFNFRNSLIMLLKNMPARKLWWFIPLRSTLDLMSSIFFLMNAMPQHSWAVHRSHADFFFKFGRWYKLRKTVQRKVQEKELKTIYKHSVVFKHFILGKQKYSDM